MAGKEKKVERRASDREAKKGFAIMLAPDDVTSCSWDGQEFPVNDGVAEVPVGAVQALAQHGFETL